jgi:hypothetical protein
VCRKNVKGVNQIAGSAGLNYFIVILSELIAKCTIGFGRLVTILEDQ